MVTLLNDTLVSNLSAGAFTYPEIGATAESELPSTYQHLDRARRLQSTIFDDASEGLMTWLMHERAGLRVESSSLRVRPDSVVRLTLGAGRIALQIPCRVVYVVEEPDRVGFAYGTLPGHPECGEESFMVERGPDGGVSLVVRAFSRPESRLARAGGPVTRRVQSLMTDRYLRALDGT